MITTSSAKVRPCKIDGCDDPHVARGWCDVHYRKWRKYDDPLAGRTARNGEPLSYFLDHLDDRDGCTIWPYGKAGGYGQLHIAGHGMVRVHILAAIVRYGPAPLILEAAHGPCHNRACFNSDHVSWETSAGNKADMLRDGTRLAGERHPNAVLTWAKVDAIIAAHDNGVSQSALAREYGVHRSTISDIVNGHTWSES